MPFKPFVHTDEHGNREVIDSYKKWEKAGFRDAVQSHKGEMKERIKEKMEKIKFRDGKRRSYVV